MPGTSQLASYARLLQLTPVSDIAPLQETTAGSISLAATTSSANLRSKGMISFLLIVVLPACIAVAYFWLLAADRYESEARFVLRMPGRAMIAAQMSDLLQSAGVTRSTDDGYIVREFLESRDAMRLLEGTADLRAAYEVPRLDLVWRFPNVFSSETDEGLYWHYRRMMSINFDSTTGVSTLKVQAFSPIDSERLTLGLLEAAEALVNRLNARSRRDAISIAEAEVDRARQRVLAAQNALTTFRERERLVDPSQATLAVLETIAKLSLELAQANVQLSELAKASPNAPQASPLRVRRFALEKQIAIERDRLAGDTQSIAPRIAEYERLMLEREFAEKVLIAGKTSVEVAKAEALRQQVYLERVTAPGRPDYPLYPWRVIWCLATITAGYMAWRMWRILAADALRHVEP